MKYFSMILFVSCYIIVSPLLFAQGPHTIPYQSILTDTNSIPNPNRNSLGDSVNWTLSNNNLINTNLGSVGIDVISDKHLGGENLRVGCVFIKYLQAVLIKRKR